MDDNRWLKRTGLLVVAALILFLIWWLWPPSAHPDSATLTSGSSAQKIDVLANDSDLFGRHFYIKTFSQGASGGTVALGPGGTSLLYTPPHDPRTTSDSFTYAIWTGHGLPSQASVSVTIKSERRVYQATALSIVESCPRGKKYSSNESTPLPEQFGTCSAIYFPWRGTNVFAQHARAVKELIHKIVKEANGHSLVIAGFTDTSGVHFAELSKARACSAEHAFEAAGIARSMLTSLVYGTNDPEVETGKGVRERLNRRVEIVISPFPLEDDGGDHVRCAK